MKMTYSEAATNIVKGYDVAIGSEHFYFEKADEEVMFAFIGTAIRHKSKGTYDERIAVRKDYYYEDELPEGLSGEEGKAGAPAGDSEWDA